MGGPVTAGPGADGIRSLVSVLVALVVGTIEVMSIIATEFNLSGGIWDYLGNLDFGLLGIIIIGIFLFSWVVSTIIYKVRKYDHITVNMGPKAEELVSGGGGK